jgi:PPOX class probable F420-dependent enzyme
MSRRDQITMTDEEITTFLDGRLIATVATVGPTGHPHLVAIWYCLVDGDLAFWTYAKSQKIVNLRRDPRISILVDDGISYDELRGVHIAGQGEIIEDPEAIFTVGREVHRRYIGGEQTDEVLEGIRATGEKRVAVRVHPEAVVSWDHGKLAGSY